METTLMEYQLDKSHFITSDQIFKYISGLNNSRVKYIKTDFIKKRQKNIVRVTGWRNINETINLKEIEVLVTGHSDHSIDKSELDILNYPKLKLWLCQNKNLDHHKLVALPIGITNRNESHPSVSRICKIIGNTDTIYQIAKGPKTIKNLVYLNISRGTFPKERGKIIDTYKDKKWVTYKNGSKTVTGHTDFIKNVNSHKFVFAPRGNGLDTHRMWEALYLRTIPIVKRHISIESFSDLPILMVESWDNITEEYLTSKYQEIMEKKYNLHKLTIKYWTTYISNY